jgi:hypothetical protein
MNPFDKLCAVLAFLLGIVLLVLGVIGVFGGCSAHFTLPPILGILPAFVGWGIVRPVIVAWRTPRRGPSPGAGPLAEPLVDRPPTDNPYDAPRY